MQLLQKCKNAIAIELRKRVLKLNTEYERKLQIIHGDATKIKTLPFFNLCIANIPYQISSPLIFKLLSHKPLFRCCILMVCIIAQSFQKCFYCGSIISKTHSNFKLNACIKLSESKLQDQCSWTNTYSSGI